MMKQIIILIIVIVFSSILYGQNTMFIPDVSGNAADTVSVSLQVNNTNDFVAVQTDIQLPSDVSYLVSSGALTARADDHILSINLLENNLLRIFIYSLTNAEFSGNSGSILDFSIILGTQSGNFTLQLINPILGNASSQNILSGYTNGNLIVYAPEINHNPESLNFGEVPLDSYADRSINIFNQGNLPLEINRIFTDNDYFEVLGDTTMTILAGGNINVTIRFNSVIKGDYQNNLFIHSNDPDEEEVSIPMQVTAFAVNELHVVNATGSSGYDVEIGFTINNMEDFNAFQFDLNLPDVLTYVENSVELSSRSVDHLVSANYVQDGILRIVAFSPTNTTFTGDNGEIVSFTANVNGIGGNYPLNLSNVIISDQQSNNIVSAYYSGLLSITAPDIQGTNYVNMGETPVTDTLTVNYSLSNVGADTLYISSFNSSSPLFWCDANFPCSIAPQQSKVFPLKFYSAADDEYSANFNILSNDPDEYPFILNVEASLFMPNYISISDIHTVVSDTTTMEINVDNYEEFVAIQVDVIVPDGFDYIQNSAELTDRADDHLLQVNYIADNTIRVIAFSMNQNAFQGNSGAVIELDFFNNLAEGNYPLQLANGVLSNISSENILKNTINGSLIVELVVLPPNNVTISVNTNTVILEWDEVPQVNSYKVFSSDKPDAGFLEDQSGSFNGCSWTTSVEDKRSFYYLKAVR